MDRLVSGSKAVLSRWTENSFRAVRFASVTVGKVVGLTILGACVAGLESELVAWPLIKAFQMRLGALEVLAVLFGLTVSTVQLVHVMRPESRLVRLARPDSIVGQWYGRFWPLVPLFAVFLMADVSFAGLTDLLNQAGWVNVQGATVIHGSIRADAENFYFLQMLDALPPFDIPSSLGITAPYRNENWLAGLLTVLFKLAVIVPLIRVALIALAYKKGYGVEITEARHAAREIKADIDATPEPESPRGTPTTTPPSA